MDLTRRRFLELLGCTATAAAVPGILGCRGGGERKEAPEPAGLPEPIQVALEEKGRTDTLPVIWLQGQSCSGCSVSLLNTESPDIVEVLTESIHLEFHQTVMGGTGEVAMDLLDRVEGRKPGEFVLVVEGSIPTGDHAHACSIGVENGEPVTMETWMKRLGPKAKLVMAVGACATFGGIPAARGNPTGAKPVSKILPEATLINIPGCPSHPDWVVGTIAHVLLFGIPELDDFKRPTMFFGKTIHETCERRSYFAEGVFAKDFGDEGCLFELGCKGPMAFCDASIRSWNGGVNWCVQSGGPCIGCTEPTFPDHDGDGIYVKLPEEMTRDIPWTGPHADAARKKSKAS